MIPVVIGLLVAIPLATNSVTELVPSDPMVTFNLTDGWVDFHLEKDGKPVINARVKVLVGSQIWAEGETGETGRGTFPRPDGMYCQVVFDLGKGLFAPIPLSFLPDGTLSPTNAPVLSGNSECCEIPSRREVSRSSEVAPESSTGSPSRDRMIIGVAVLLVNGTVLGWVLRRPRHAQRPMTQTTENET
jgi:hypothetical protein